ncbi:MAG: glycoside hydrolase family 31 protein [bacterium]|nr:glycoside hydrolase family 31 protein [bacterium]
MIRHHPRGIGHPYARSADQRSPFLPLGGEPVHLGIVIEGPSSTRVVCEWEVGGAVVELEMAPGTGGDDDAAALAGGSGHLAEAQAESLTSAGAWSVTSPPVQVGEATRYRFRADGETTDWFEVEAGRWVREGGDLVIGGPAADRLVPGTLEWLVSGSGVSRARLALGLEEGERVLGFGERFDSVDQRGRRLDSVVFEQYKQQGEHRRTYLPMPFAHVIGGEGWGFHVATSRRVWFDVGASDADLLWIEVDLGIGTQPPGEVVVRGYGGTPSEVLDAFLSEVGRPRELPEWVFRLWASGNEWNTQARVMREMDLHHEYGIPVGAVVIEAWSDENGITVFRDADYEVREDGSPFRYEDFSFDPNGAWPDPAGMVRELHSRGVRVLLWQIPLTKTIDHERELGPQVAAEGSALVASGHAIREEDGSPYLNRGWWFPKALMPDFSTPEARAWWAERRRYLVEGVGIDGFKTDGGEHAWGAELLYSGGRRGAEMNNLNPVGYARALGELLESCGKAPVTFSRAGYTGSQPHGVFWAGDEDSTWQAFRNSVTAGITAGACGILYWGWDLAGFSGPVPEPELYLRATWASALMPVMQYHSEFNHHREPKRDRTPWWVAEVHDSPGVVDEFREAVRFRECLVPYLAEQAREAIARGLPLMRALPFEFVGDERVWEFPSQWMLGSDLLVAPVLAPGAAETEVYLPDPGGGAVWRCEWTGGEFAPGVHAVDTRLTGPRGFRPPVFRRG